MLALWFPFLSANRLRAQEPDCCGASPESASETPSETPPDLPLVFIAKAGGALRIVAADAAAAAAGLVPPLSLADARARIPGLVAFAADPAADAAWLTGLAEECRRFSPLVACLPPDAVIIDLAGVTHLFGGEAAVQADAVAHCAAAGMAVRAACGPTAEAALALARYAVLPVGDEAAAIRALPVAALGLGEEAALALIRAGLKTIGDVAVRPASAIAARFGLAAVTALARLMGEAHTPMVPLLPKLRLGFERRFAEPVAQQDAIAVAFAALLGDAMAALGAQGLGGRRFRLTLDRSDGARRSLTIETGAPTRDAALVLRLFDERIAGLADPIDPGFGYDRMRIVIPAFEPLAAVQPDLGGKVAADAELAALIDRLGVRFGAARLRHILPADSHIPEQAQLALPVADSPPPEHWPIAWAAADPGDPPLRPLFLFDPPQRVEVIAEVPDGPPHRFRWRRALHEVRRFEGPERIAAEWWKRAGGEADGTGALTRDYYRVEDVRGRRYWIFRHGLYAEKAQPKWYVHGLFA